MQRLFLFGLICMIGSCQQPSESLNLDEFEQELLSLKEFFHIPGMAVLVSQDGQTIYENYFGYADLASERPVDSTTIFPIASVSKTFAAVMVLQLAEEGKLNLDDPIDNYLDRGFVGDSVLIKHVLSHSSELEPGSFFNYSGRYGLLTQIIEQAGQNNIVEQVKKRILGPLELSSTVPLYNESVVSALTSKLAQPYYFFGETEPGHFEVGYSSSSGLASTVRDLVKFNRGLEEDLLLPATAKAKMYTPSNQRGQQVSPYGYGIFSQEFLGEELVWGYGQEDCHASLFLKVPSKKLCLSILTNNNLMSDPPRLINGDVTYSLFALNFLKHFVFDLDNRWTFESVRNNPSISIPADSSFAPFYRQELLAHSIAASFMSQADPAELEITKRLITQVLDATPNYLSYANVSTMRVLLDLSAAGVRDFDAVIEAIGEHLLSQQIHDPYCNVYLGFHFAGLDQNDKAAIYFKNIAEANNLKPFWYTIEACDFLGNYYLDTDPSLAKSYYQKIVDIGWNMGGKLDKAKEILARL